MQTNSVVYQWGQCSLCSKKKPPTRCADLGNSPLLSGASDTSLISSMAPCSVLQPSSPQLDWNPQGKAQVISFSSLFFLEAPSTRWPHLRLGPTGEAGR